MSFWDSSAIVPLCVNQKNSQSAWRFWRMFSNRFVWRECVVEGASAFALLERQGMLDESSVRKAEDRLKLAEAKWTAIEPHSRIIEIARTLPAIYGLKALDSLQLAAALVWCKELSKNKNFVAADRKLLKAAETAGFTIHDLS